jgi:uncharacterized protein (UPF0333 family)
MKKYIFLFIILILIGLGLYAYFILGNQMRSVRGLDSGKEYVAKMYSDYSIAGNNCQGEDSNDDGYITCNFRLKEKVSGNEKTVNLQCPTFIKSYLATSCKEVGITINQN